MVLAGKPRLLMMVHLPPPYHGVTVMNEILLDTPFIKYEFQSRLLKMEFVRRASDIGSFSFGKLLVSLKLFLRAGWELVFHKPDIVYLVPSPHGFAFMRDAMLVALIRVLGGKILFHIYGRIELEKCSRCKRWILEHMFRGQHLIHLTERLARLLNGIRDSHSYIVYNAAREEIDPLSLSEAMVERDTTKPVLLFFSNMTAEKGVFDFIETVQRLSSSSVSCTARIAGIASSEVWDKMQREIATRGLSSVIETIQGLTRKDIVAFRRLHASSHIFVLPTYYANEASPLVLIDALQFGLPVVSTSIGGIPDMICNGKNGYIVAPRDIDALASALRRLVEDATLRREISLYNRSDYEKRFSIPAFQQAMERVFSSSIK